MGLICKAFAFALAMVALAGVAASAGTPIRILALGDSLTQGHGLPPGEDYPAVLERTLRAQGLDVALVNGGVSGDTSAGVRARLDWSLADPKGLPDGIILEIGGNDGLRGVPVPEMEKNLDAILAELRSRRIPVLLAGMKAPRNFGAQYAADYDAVFPRLAEKYGVLFYPFFLDGVALDPALEQDDGLHPNPAGVHEIVGRLVPLATRLVRQAEHARPAPPAARAREP